MAKKNKVEKAAPKKKPSVYEVEDSGEDGFGNKAPEEQFSSKSNKSTDKDRGSVYKVIEVIGSSNESWEHAAQVAVERASQSLQDLRVAEVVDQDLKIEGGAISAYRTKLRLSFKFKQ